MIGAELQPGMEAVDMLRGKRKKLRIMRRSPIVDAPFREIRGKILAAKSLDARPAHMTRLPNNHGLNYPYAEAVLINCKLKGIPAIGWGPIDDDTTHLHLWEFNSTDLDGKPVDVSQRHPVSKQLTMPKDAQTIEDYSNPAFVLGGWTPAVE